MNAPKQTRFPVSIRWRGGRLARADAPDKRSIELERSSELDDSSDGYWSPDDLLVAAAASCYALTLAAVAELLQAPLLDASIDAAGRMRLRDDGRLSFAAIELDAQLETLPGAEDAVARAAAAAESRCSVTQALGIPVHVTVGVSAVEAALPTSRR